RKVETLQRRLRLHRLAYVGGHGTDVQACGLRMVTEPDLERAETAVQKLRRACSRVPALQTAGVVVEDRIWCLALHVRHAEPQVRVAATEEFGKLVSAEGLFLHHADDSIEAVPDGASMWRAVPRLLVGSGGALRAYVAARGAVEETVSV